MKSPRRALFPVEEQHLFAVHYQLTKKAAGLVSSICAPGADGMLMLVWWMYELLPPLHHIELSVGSNNFRKDKKTDLRFNY